VATYSLMGDRSLKLRKQMKLLINYCFIYESLCELFLSLGSPSAVFICLIYVKIKMATSSDCPKKTD
jgi:hypothetical protein